MVNTHPSGVVSTSQSTLFGPLDATRPTPSSEVARGEQTGPSIGLHSAHLFPSDRLPVTTAYTRLTRQSVICDGVSKAQTCGRADVDCPLRTPSTRTDKHDAPGAAPEVRTLIDAANGGDTDAFLASCNPAPGFRRPPEPQVLRIRIDQTLERCRLHRQKRHGKGGPLLCRRRWRGRRHRRSGERSFSGPKTFIFRMDDNKIAHMRITA